MYAWMSILAYRGIFVTLSSFVVVHGSFNPLFLVQLQEEYVVRFLVLTILRRRGLFAFTLLQYSNSDSISCFVLYEVY